MSNHCPRSYALLFKVKSSTIFKVENQTSPTNFWKNTEMSHMLFLKSKFDFLISKSKQLLPKALDNKLTVLGWLSFLDNGFHPRKYLRSFEEHTSHLEKNICICHI